MLPSKLLSSFDISHAYTKDHEKHLGMLQRKEKICLFHEQEHMVLHSLSAFFIRKDSENFNGIIWFNEAKRLFLFYSPIITCSVGGWDTQKKKNEMQ